MPFSLDASEVPSTACALAALILQDGGAPLTAENITAIVSAAGVKGVDAVTAGVFATACEGRDVSALIFSGSSSSSSGSSSSGSSSSGSSSSDSSSDSD